ncbi:hypothetical protein FHS20_004112 [Phyllobacterium endophyticum]|nr:hypothetical protein [Phyllobacterium endophyticum]
MRHPLLSRRRERRLASYAFVARSGVRAGKIRCGTRSATEAAGRTSPVIQTSWLRSAKAPSRKLRSRPVQTISPLPRSDPPRPPVLKP